MLLNSKACQWTLVVLTLAVCPAFAADEAGPLARAQAKFREAKYDEAAQVATEVIQQDTESTAAYRLRVAAYEQLGKLDLAIYVGLYHEAAGANELARKHIEIAATQYYSPHYMGAVARVHL